LDERKALVSIPPQPQKAEFHNVDIKGLEVQDCREFGAEHLSKQILDKLDLDKLFRIMGLSSESRKLAHISIAARAIYGESEYKTSQILAMNSELAQLYKYNDNISHKHLYDIADILYDNKEKIEDYIYARVCNLFNFDDKIVIFDISNTYFATTKRNSKIAKHARSKEKRHDCPLVVFTGVINSQGFIRHSEIYEGNKSDSATLVDMIKNLERYSNTAEKKTVVIDAGIATDKNLEYLQSQGYKYVCVSRKRLKDYELNQSGVNHLEFTDRDKHKVELKVFKPEQYTDTWMYVQSEQKRIKEQSMNTKLNTFFEQELENIKSSFSKKGGTKLINKVWERIGRAKQKHKRVSAKYEIKVVESQGKAIDLTWKYGQSKVQQEKEKGVYFIRTNYDNPSEKDLWDIYNTIREVEATFRTLKSDLNIRPINHQHDHRVKAHIFLTILAYQMVNTIRYMLKQNSLTYDWKNIVRIMSTQKIQTVKLPTDKKVIYLRKSSVPIAEVRQIYSAAQCTETIKPVKKYVVYH
jgi:transposase